MTIEQIATEVRVARHRCRLKGRELAVRAQVSPSTVTRFERNVGIVRMDAVMRMVSAVGLELRVVTADAGRGT